MNDQTPMEHNIEEVSKDKKSFMDWVKVHKKQLILTGLSISTIILIVLGLKNKHAIKDFWDGLKDEIKKADLYNSKWFENAKDTELNLEREKVRLAYCSSGDDYNAACRLQNLLWRFDKEMSKRAWGGEKPHAPSIHREHGWYLPNNDD